MGDRRAASAEQAAGSAASGRPTSDQRHLLHPADRCAVARPARALRSEDDGLQPLPPLGEGRRLAAPLRGAGRAITAVAASDRQLDRPGAPARCGGKKGGELHAIGRSRGGLSTKIHAVVDGRGLPVRLVLTAGQASDKTTAPELVAPLGLTGDVVADRGYFGRAVIEAIEALGATAHIPSQSNVRVVRSVDPGIYRN